MEKKKVPKQYCMKSSSFLWDDSVNSSLVTLFVKNCNKMFHINSKLTFLRVPKKNIASDPTPDRIDLQ